MKRVVCVFFALLALRLSFVESKLLSCQMSIRPGKSQFEDCLKFCPDECENGVCDFTNKECICKLGFSKVNGKCVSNCVEGDCLCKSGFKRQNNRCVPFCSAGCPELEECTAPDVCSCVKQYHREAGKCRPDCEEDCGRNALCVAPNTCECRLGYERRNGRNGNCEPVCSVPCGGSSKCVAPDVCMCSLISNGTSLAGDVCYKQECLKSFDLYLAEVQVSCKSYDLLQFLVFAASFVIGLLFCGILISTCVQCSCKGKRESRPRRAPSELIVAYHPDEDAASILPHYNTVPRRPAIAPPPSYRTLTLKQKKTKQKLKRKMLDP